MIEVTMKRCFPTLYFVIKLNDFKIQHVYVEYSLWSGNFLIAQIDCVVFLIKLYHSSYNSFEGFQKKRKDGQ